MDDRRHSARMRFLKNLPWHGLKVLLAGGVWLAVVLNAAAAGDTPLATQPGDNTFQQFRMMAQTFTPSQNAGLVKVSLKISWSPWAGAQNGTVSIQRTTSGVPDGNDLASAVLEARQWTNDWHDFTFTPGVKVLSTDKYAIVVTTSALRFNEPIWRALLSDGYPGGQLLIKSGSSWIPSTPKDFAFKVFGDTSTNTAPNLITNNATVTAGEGSAATNAGTYTDADGDTVAFTASSGAVTKTGTSAGSWAWTQRVGDEGSSFFATVTANDGHGNQTITTFSVTVLGVKPTATIHGAPASVVEGGAVSLTGTGSSDSAEDNAGPWTFAWTLIVTKPDGSTLSPVTGTGPSFGFAVPDDGAYAVTLTATDDGGFTSDPRSVTIAGLNANPIATITGAYSPTAPVMTTQEPIEFKGRWTDVGRLDTHTITWTFGDGSSSVRPSTVSGSENLEAYHAYASPGTYHVGLTVLDDNGGSDSATYTVVIQTPSQAIAAIANSISGYSGLNAGQKNSLLAKLRAASAAAERGSTGAGCNQLDAFLNEVDADTKNGTLSTGEQTTLIAATRATQRSLGCFSTLLDFLDSI